MRFAVTVLLLSLLPAAWAEDWYVSDDMQYGRGVVSDAHCTNDLPYAVSKATGGSTVWVKDGFVCESGSGYAYNANGNNWGLCRLIIPKNVTVRSESGYVDEAAGKGATIRGRFDEEAGASKHYLGSNSMRCAGFDGTSGGARLIGFVFEKGTSNYQSDDQGGGGAVVGQNKGQIVSNCVIRTCYAQKGGGVRGISAYNLVVTNCAAGQGGGAYVSNVYDSLFANNNAYNNGGGAAKDCVFSNCVVRSNSCSGEGGAFCNGTAIDCIVTNNTSTARGGGCGTYYTKGGDHFVGTALGKAILAYNTTNGRGGGSSGWALTNVIVHSNLAQTHEGGGVYGGGSVYHCIVTNNESYSSGGGLSQVTSITDCRVSDNRVTGSGQDGGGIYVSSVVRDSYISGNTITRNGGGISNVGCCTNCDLVCNYAKGAGDYGYGGGGAYVSNLYDCRVISNTVAVSECGAGIAKGSATKTYFYGNVASGWSGGGGAGWDTTFESCYVANNSAGRYGGGLYASSSKNCIFVGNVQLPHSNDSAGGGAVQGGTHYNALFAYNTANNSGGATLSANCFNCTAYSNTNLLYKEASSVSGGYHGGMVVNCISYGNVGRTADAPSVASNSCIVVDTTLAKYVDCISEDPKFRDAAAGDFAPRNRKCRDAALAFDWMRDASDVRSKDLKGNPRIFRAAPDMGCIENYLNGAVILVR